MSTYDVPGVGTVVVVIDRQPFFQSGYSLDSLEDARHVDGRELSVRERAIVEGHLRNIGALT
jgi:hypothetical protein